MNKTIPAETPIIPVTLIARPMMRFLSAIADLLPPSPPSAKNAQDQGEHDREDDRCHDREIDVDISVRALVLYIAWQKRKSGRDVRPPGSRAPICEPTNEGKSQYCNNEDLQKGIHDAIGDHTIDNSLVVFERGQNIVENRRGGRSAPTINSSVRTREYLTTAEIERLMAAARKSSRYGHRDATMILIGYRHGLRASELCDLQWSQVELATGRLHVRRAKNGSPSVHPMQGDEIRALRRLQREQGLSSHVFMTERDGPMTPKAFHALFDRIGARAKMQFPIHPHMLRHGCGYALTNAGHDTRALQAWLGHKNIQHTVRYTELAPDRFKDFWR